MKCAYRSCGKSRKNHPGLFMYTFPIKDVERCKKWIENSGNAVDVPVSEYKFKALCQFHFISEDFVNATKHRLIKAAIPCHFQDPQGEAKKKERQKEFGGNGACSKIQRKPFHFLKSNLLENTKKLSPNRISGHVTVRNDLLLQNRKKSSPNQISGQVIVRNDLFPSNQSIETKDPKRRYLIRTHNKHDLQIPSNKLLFQWLRDLREKRASNKKNVSYYVNVDELLNTFDASNLFDFEDPWHKRTDTEKKTLKCYSRRNRNNGSSSSEVCQKIIQSKPVSLSQTVTNEYQAENQKLEDDNCENESPSSGPDEHLWRSEDVDKKEIHNQIASECELSDIDVKYEEISEYRIHWSEEDEDDKSCIKILDVPKLQQEHFTDDKSYSQSNRMHITRLKKEIRRKRFISGLRSNSETEKYIYMINRNRILIDKLKRKLRTCYRELKMLKKNRVFERNEDKKTAASLG